MTNSSSICKLITFILDKKLENNLSECPICLKNVDKFYIICKPECLNYSYCKDCIYKIAYESKRCPYTRILFNEKDICLDYRKNIMLEEEKKLQEEFKKLFNNKSIKNISIEIKTF